MSGDVVYYEVTTLGGTLAILFLVMSIFASTSAEEHPGIQTC